MPPWNNPAALASLFAVDGVQRHPFGEPPGGPQQGHVAIRNFFAGFDRLFKTWEHLEATRTVRGDRAVWEGLAQGIHKDSGKFIRLPIVFVLEFNQDGKVNEARVYTNSAMIAEQIK